MNPGHIEHHSEILDKALDDMSNVECDDFNNVAPNAEHINKQDCAVKASSTASMICLMIMVFP